MVDKLSEEAGVRRRVSSAEILASIVIVTRNEERNIGRCLDGVFSQKSSFKFEVTIIDSASEDKTREIAAGFPVNLIRIEKEEFHHGGTRNMGARLSNGRILVFLQGDAWPADDQWLKNLVGPLLDDPSLSAVYGRQIPREDCDPINHFRYEWNYPNTRIIKAIENKQRFQHRLHFFSTANCAIRREIWEAIQFPEDVPIFEDMTFAKLAINQGKRILYDPAAAVVHSHNLGIKEIFARYRLVAKIQTRYNFSDKAGRNFFAEGIRYLASGSQRVSRRGGAVWLGRFFLHTLSGCCGLFTGYVEGLRGQRAIKESGLACA